MERIREEIALIHSHNKKVLQMYWALSGTVANPEFWIGGTNLRNLGQSRQYFVTLIIKINLKNEIFESRTF